eukprot:scaffold17718_cov109-Isochrysis_galbana.AAC.3
MIPSHCDEAAVEERDVPSRGSAAVREWTHIAAAQRNGGKVAFSPLRVLPRSTKARGCGPPLRQ